MGARQNAQDQKGAEEEIELQINGKAVNLTSLHPLQCDISWLLKLLKTLVETKYCKGELEIWSSRECHK